MPRRRLLRRGWSDPASAEQDGVAVTTDLRTCWTAPTSRVRSCSLATRQARSTSGFLLGGIPNKWQGWCCSTPSLPKHSRAFRRIQRSTASSAASPHCCRRWRDSASDGSSFRRSGVAWPARDIQRLHHASPRLYRSLRDEFAQLPTSLAQARSFQNLGDRPLVVVTATRDALAGWLPLQDRMARLSTNSSHRLVPYTHDALVTDRPRQKRRRRQSVTSSMRSVRDGSRNRK